MRCFMEFVLFSQDLLPCLLVIYNVIICVFLLRRMFSFQRRNLSRECLPKIIIGGLVGLSYLAI